MGYKGPLSLFGKDSWYSGGIGWKVRMGIRVVIRIENYSGMSELAAPKSIRSLLKLNISCKVLGP